MWNKKQQDYSKRLASAQPYLKNNKFVDANDIVALLTKVLQSGDLVCIEGDNQKQATYLAKALTQLDPSMIHHLHMIQSAISLPEHLDIFEKGIAEKIDFSFSGPQAVRLANMLEKGDIKIGNIHTYNELYARLVTDLTLP